MFITGPIQRIGDSFINPMQDPPVMPFNTALAARLARTGDIIIENNQAFPQFHAVFGAFVPDMIKPIQQEWRRTLEQLTVIFRRLL
jgi:hypothetical protein